MGTSSSSPAAPTVSDALTVSAVSDGSSSDSLVSQLSLKQKTIAEPTTTSSTVSTEKKDPASEPCSTSENVGTADNYSVVIVADEETKSERVLLVPNSEICNLRSPDFLADPSNYVKYHARVYRMKKPSQVSKLPEFKREEPTPLSSSTNTCDRPLTVYKPLTYSSADELLDPCKLALQEIAHIYAADTTGVTSRPKWVRSVSAMLDISERAHGIPNKAAIALLIMQFLAREIVHVEATVGFREEVRKKLIEFHVRESIPWAADYYAWFFGQDICLSSTPPPANHPDWTSATTRPIPMPKFPEVSVAVAPAMKDKDV